MSSVITIERVSMDASVSLLELSRQTFFDAFAHLNDPANMQAFADKAFTSSSFDEQLNNPDSEFYYARIDGNVAGYIKLNFNGAQTEFHDPQALELERIYVFQEYQGRKIGHQLLDFAIQTAISKNFHYIWLGVWEHNLGAIRFYQNQGFEIFSSHPFMLGADQQTDLLMKKKL